ncbi:hypothetical protein, partial [Kitasatospora sp. NPDC093558]|uniref:hypothetical protein n=1 Tax=Kitasatospora sp. NPDC093558 TaxID=3155201 RepID=UPI00342FF218
MLEVAAHAVVTGRVTIDGSLPAAQLALRIRNQRFGGTPDQLGTVTTDGRGEFVLAYDPGTAAVNLEVTAARDDKPLGPVSYAVGLFHTLTLVAPTPPTESEYARLSKDLAAQVGELAKLAQAQEGAQRQDLTVLSRSTGWDPRLIALTVMAERLAGANNNLTLDASVIYGLLRAGLPSDVAALALVDDQTVTKALTLAKDGGILDIDAAGIATATQRFAEFTVHAKLTMKPPGSTATYAELLGHAGLNEAQQADFAKVAFAHRGDPEQLWSQAEGLGLHDQIDSLKLQGKLALLTGNSAPLMAHLLGPDLRHPAELVDQGLVTAEDWERKLSALVGGDTAAITALIPASYEASTPAVRLSAYAADLARKVRASYPTQVVTQLVSTGALAVGNTASTVALLKAATADGFVMGATPPEAFFVAKGAGMFGVTEEQFEAARQDLRDLHRAYQLSPDHKSMAVLTELGLTSAYDIAEMGEEEFSAAFLRAHLKLFKTEPGAVVAQLVHRKAQQVSSVSYAVFGAAQTLKAQPGTAATSAAAVDRHAAQSNLLRHFPTMEGLFGSLDYIECPDCRSVLSPAAYFVDLLQFIDPDKPTWDNFLANWKSRHAGLDYTAKYARPIDAQQAPRPDLFAIELTCENTLTALPYIDIVNEILEYYVAHAGLAAEAAHDTGEATTEELVAEPQNLLAEAYDKLLDAWHPDPLPFDLWIETVREFTAGFGTPLAKVMEVFRASNALFDDIQRYDRADTYIEYLGFSPAEAARLTDPAPLASWWRLYGYADAGQATTVAVDADSGQRIDLNSAKTLSRRLGVTYQDLVDIVQTGFVNPALPGLGLLYRLGVSIRDAKHYTEHRLDPPPVTPEQKADRLAVDAFDARLTALAARANVSADRLRTEIAGLPYGQVLVLADPDTGADFDLTTLRHADGSPADPLAFVRIAHFVRLWRKLGWSIAETDDALKAFVPAHAPFVMGSLDQRPLRSALIHLSQLVSLMDRPGVDPKLRPRLAALWMDLPTTGRNPLYAQLFLTRSVLLRDPVFDHPLGRYLDWTEVDPAKVPRLRDHLRSVQAVLGLSSDDIQTILTDAGIKADVDLDLRTLSTLHRYALLAEILQLSVSDLVTLKRLSGMDPFEPLYPDALEHLPPEQPYRQATLEFAGLARRVADSGLSVPDIDALLRERRDAKPTDGPVPDAVLQQLKVLADGARAIRAEHAVPAAPGSLSDEQLRQELGLVLERDVVDKLLAMVQGTAGFSTSAPEVKKFFDRYLLKQDITAGTSFGFLEDSAFNLLINPTPLIPPGLSAAAELVAREAVEEAVQAKRTVLATAFLPFLQGRLIQRLVVDTITAQAGAEPALVEDLLTDARLLGRSEPLLAAFEHIDSSIDTTKSSFEGFLEVPVSGVYRFTSVVGPQGGFTKLSFDHLDQPVVLSGTATAGAEITGTVELQAGRLYAFAFTTTGLDGASAHLDVQSALLARGGVVQQLRLYPKDVVTGASAALALIEKILSLVHTLGIGHDEVRHLATHSKAFDNLRLGDLPTSRVGDTPEELAAAVVRFRWLARLIDYAALKRELGGGEELLAVLQAAGSTAPNPLTADVYPILAHLTGQSVEVVSATATTIWPAGPTFDSERPV